MTDKKKIKTIVIALIIMSIITPIGIFLPEWGNAGDAWGEWSVDAVKEQIGFVPEGMKKDSEIWKAPVADYTLSAEEGNLCESSVHYIISALIGIFVIGLFTLVLYKIFKR